MRSLFINIKNTIPYLVLIVTYFFFINIEARRDRNDIFKSYNSKVEIEDNVDKIEKNVRIEIPVIPYNQ